MSDLIQIAKPESVLYAEKQAAKQLQLERRGIARDILAGGGMHRVNAVDEALAQADELLAKTKVEP